VQLFGLGELKTYDLIAWEEKRESFCTKRRKTRQRRNRDTKRETQFACPGAARRANGPAAVVRKKQREMEDGLDGTRSHLHEMSLIPGEKHRHGQIHSDRRVN
jgi:hypothetical protein